MKMEETECSETLAFIIGAGESPRRKHTTFRTWKKFEIKEIKIMKVRIYG
jgi:hypothetical protein